MKIFAERLCELLRLNQVTQSELARRIGVSSHTINKYCLGKHEPSLETLELICKALDCTYDDILGKL